MLCKIKRRYITSIPSLKGSFGVVDGIDNWHAKGPTSVYQEKKKDKKAKINVQNYIKKLN